mmetsp:Transcript_24654/g.58673  ORF Transcript_24654/g.58673 Transcript_24654/m.58673 type:complete len:206 (+) Transcript_24654:732-1349(+)
MAAREAEHVAGDLLQQAGRLSPDHAIPAVLAGFERSVGQERPHLFGKDILLVDQLRSLVYLLPQSIIIGGDHSFCAATQHPLEDVDPHSPRVHSLSQREADDGPRPHLRRQHRHLEGQELLPVARLSQEPSHRALVAARMLQQALEMAEPRAGDCERQHRHRPLHRGVLADQVLRVDDLPRLDHDRLVAALAHPHASTPGSPAVR